MNTSRRRFLRDTAAATALAGIGAPTTSNAASPAVAKEALDAILAQPVLKLDFLKSPVTVASMELLRYGKTYLLRTRSTDGVEAISVPNSSRMADLHPLFLANILPFFINKDARTLETLLWEIYR